MSGETAGAGCDCHPAGVSPETYEGPQEWCEVHGQTRMVLIQHRDAARDLVDEVRAERDQLRARLRALDGVREAYDRRGQAMGHLAAAVNASEDAIAELRAEVAAAEQRGAEALAALRELVRLKDGPRDAAYERDKPKAWDAARAAAVPVPDTTKDDRPMSTETRPQLPTARYSMVLCDGNAWVLDRDDDGRGQLLWMRPGAHAWAGNLMFEDKDFTVICDPDKEA